jgi:hypothetical protein
MRKKRTKKTLKVSRTTLLNGVGGGLSIGGYQVPGNAPNLDTGLAKTGACTLPGGGNNNMMP